MERDRRQETGNDWLQLKLVGTSSNRGAIGARVSLTISEGGPTQVRETNAGSNDLSQDENLVHFGLGAPRPGTLARVHVRWPSGKTTDLHDLPRNVRMTEVE